MTVSSSRSLQKRILISVFLDSFAIGMTLPVIPRIIEDLSTHKANAGLISGLLLAGAALMQFFVGPFLGFLSDRYSRKLIILISTFGMTVDYLFVGLSPNLGWLSLGRVLGGLTAATLSTAYAFLSDVTSDQSRIRAFSALKATVSGGYILGPLVGAYLSKNHPQTPLIYASGLSLAAFFYALFILPEPPHVRDRSKFAWSQANPWRVLKHLTQGNHLFPKMSINFIIFFCQCVFQSVFALYLVNRYSFTIIEVGLVQSCVALGDIALQLGIAPRIVQKLGETGAVTVGMSLGALGFFILGWAPTSLFFLFSLIPMAFLGLAEPAIQVLMTQEVPDFEQGRLQGLNSSFTAGAGIVAPILFGAIYTLFSDRWLHLHLLGAPFFVAGILILKGILINLKARSRRIPA